MALKDAEQDAFHGFFVFLLLCLINYFNLLTLKPLHMESLVPLLIQLASGAVGGNLAGSLLKNFNMGTLWNSVAGIAGGGIGGQILGSVLGMGTGGMDIAGILSQVAGGGVGGGILLVVVGLIRNAMKK